MYSRWKSRLVKASTNQYLELAEDKTKIIKFSENANGTNESFDFLGFTHKESIGINCYYKVLHLKSQKKLKAKK